MCMEDIIIGRSKRSNVFQHTCSGSNEQILPFNPLRTGITFACQSTGIQVAPAPIDASGVGTIQVPGQWNLLYMDIEQYGDMITKPWNIFSNLIGQVVLVIEVYLAREK